MQDLDFTPVNLSSATDTKDGSACESLQSLEIRITALDWIKLLPSVDTERILKVGRLFQVRPCSLVDISTSLYQVATCVTKLHGATC
jgi:hypothetical protein